MTPLRPAYWVRRIALWSASPSAPWVSVLRAFLAERMDYGRATQIAATVGQGMAFLFGLFGLLGTFGNGPILFLIAFFVYMGAGQEAAEVQAELAFRGMRAGQAMMTQFATLSPSDPLSRAVEQLLAGAQDDFPVVQEGAVAGLLSRSARAAPGSSRTSGPRRARGARRGYSRARPA